MGGGRFADGTVKMKMLMIVAWGMRLLLALIFIWAGAAKLLDVSVFVDGIRGFQMFPEMLVNFLAMVVPVIEIAAGLLLVSPRGCRVGALLAAVLALCFVGLFAWVAYQGISVHCSCFGAFGDVTSPAVGMARGAVLLAMAALVYGFAARRALAR